MLGYSGFGKSTRTNWIMANAVKTSVRPAVPGLAVSDLSTFLGFGDFLTATEEAMMQTFIDTAIEMLVKYTGYEPAEVNYTIKYDRHPRAVRPTGGIALTGEYAEWISLPRQPVKAVNEVRTSGNVLALTDYETDITSNPARVSLDFYDVIIDHPSFAEIQVDITCGPTGAVNPSFVMAALMLASYLYNNRGCGTKMAISESGSASIASPLKVAVGGL